MTFILSLLPTRPTAVAHYVRLSLLSLEEKVLPTIYYWGGLQNTTCSNLQNWWIKTTMNPGGENPAGLPGVNDDLFFGDIRGQGITNNDAGTGKKNATVDAQFPATVGGIITWWVGYDGMTITLQHDLTVVGNNSDFGSGTIDGTGNFFVGDNPATGNPQNAATLTWEGGTFKGATSSYVLVNTISRLEIRGGGALYGPDGGGTLDGRYLTLKGTGSWTNGNLTLNNNAYFWLSAFGSMNITAAKVAVLGDNTGYYRERPTRRVSR